MDIKVDFYDGNLFDCSVCGTPHPPCSSEEETWIHDDFFRYRTFLHARVPHIACCCGEVAVERPWCRAGSKFVRLSAQNGHARPADGAVTEGAGTVSRDDDVLFARAATEPVERPKGRLLTLFPGKRRIKS